MWVDQFQRIQFHVPPAPALVQIELNNACNLSCKACPRDELPILQKPMAYEVFKNVLRHLNRLGLKRVDLGGWGEVTVHPEFKQILLDLKNQEFDVSFTTNGLPIKPDLIDCLLASSCSQITFSFDSLSTDYDGYGGHLNNKAYQNLNTLLEKRDPKKLQVKVNTIVQKSNQDEILELLDNFDSLGIDMQVLFGPNKARDHQGFRLAHEVEVRLYRQILEFKQEGRWTMRITTPLDRYALGQRSMWYRYGKFCAQTFQNLYINREGGVTPCCLLPDREVARLNKGESLEELWSSEGFREFRRDQVEICKGCDVHQFKL
jgi:MoaA/NifB/PqqE/SkfB family radical SAM enzyme